MSKNDVDSLILQELLKINSRLELISEMLAKDRDNLWKILALTIGGAFALIGIKLAIP